MRLRLSLLNKPADAPDHADACEFTPNGGTIGRFDCDWVLPDPTKLTSRYHAEIQYTEATFFIVDRSSNGVYLNDAGAPIGKDLKAPLKDGDRLGIGIFEILVKIDASTPPTEPSPKVPVGGPWIPPDWLKGLPPTGDNNPAPMDRGRIIQPPLTTPGAPAQTPPPIPDRRIRIPTPGGVPPTPPSTPVPTAEGHAAPPPSTTDRSEAALAALLAGAGVADLKVPGGATPESFRLIGEILALYVEGSVQLLNAISAVKKDYRIDQTIVSSACDSNPLRWVQPGAAVARLLGSRDKDYMPPAAAVDDTMNIIKAHQIVVLKAMEAAFKSFVHDELAPEKLKERFDAQGKPRFAPSRDAWYWKQYALRYREIAARAESDYLELLGAAFRAEYERQVRPIRAQAKGAAAKCD